MICLIISIIATLIFTFVAAFIYRLGIKDGYHLYKGEAPETIVKRKIPPKPPDKADIVRSNIENYNGGSGGQIDYEE